MLLHYSYFHIILISLILRFSYRYHPIPTPRPSTFLTLGIFLSSCSYVFFLPFFSVFIFFLFNHFLTLILNKSNNFLSKYMYISGLKVRKSTIIIFLMDICKRESVPRAYDDTQCLCIYK